MKKVITLAKATRLSLAYSRRKTKVVNQLERKGALYIDPVIIASIEAMFVEEHKKKGAEEVTTFIVHGVPVIEEVIIESIQA